MSRSHKTLLQTTALCSVMASGLLAMSLPSVAETTTNYAQAEARLELSLSGKTIAEALQSISRQAGFQLAGNAAYLEGGMKSPLVGSYTARDAVNTLLAGTGISYEWDGTDTLIITGRETKTLQDGAGSDSDGRNTFVLEEIIVTAEKRAESLQDIPIAISAFTGESIERSGVTGIQDLKQVAPSLQFSETQGIEMYVSIRGVGSDLRNVGAEPGVTITQDGVPFSNQVLFDADFFDVERVEVLRGPQGTINGRNATGGAINIHLKRPTDEFEAGLKATVGNYDRMALEGHLSGPIMGSGVRGRLAVRSDRSDGWLTNTYRNENHFETDKIQIRGSLLADLAENVEAYLVLDGMIDRGSIASALDLGPLRPDTPSFSEVLGVPGLDRENLEYQANYPNTRKVENYKASLKLTWDISPSTTVTAISGYVDYKQNRQDDFDGTIIDGSSFDSTVVDVWQLSQEVTLTADLTDRLDVVAGGLYMRATVEEPLDFGLPFAGFPLGSFILLPEQDLNSYAVYTQWRYRLSDELRVSLGGRYTHDRKDYYEEDIILGTSATLEDTQNWGAFTPRLSLDYTPTNDLTFYASIARGFKAGGFNTFGTVGGNPNSFKPEYVWSYEVGLKSNWLENRVRSAISGFYMDYTDLQQSLLIIIGDAAIPTQTVRNASSAKIYGVEMELEALVSDNFKLNASGTWLDATYGDLLSNDQVFPELGERDLTGNRLVRSPEWQFSVSGDYSVDVGENLELRLRADYQWQDRIYFSFYNHQLDSQAAYGLLNLSASLGSLDGKWVLTAFGRNVLDKRYDAGSYVQNIGGVLERYGDIGAPRMYGLSLAYNF